MRYIFSLTHSTPVTGGVLAAAGYCASWVPRSRSRALSSVGFFTAAGGVYHSLVRRLWCRGIPGTEGEGEGGRGEHQGAGSRGGGGHT